MLNDKKVIGVLVIGVLVIEIIVVKNKKSLKKKLLPKLTQVRIDKSLSKNSRAGSGLRFHQGTRQYYRR